MHQFAYFFFLFQNICCGINKIKACVCNLPESSDSLKLSAVKFMPMSEIHVDMESSTDCPISSPVKASGPNESATAGDLCQNCE